MSSLLLSRSTGLAASLPRTEIGVFAFDATGCCSWVVIRIFRQSMGSLNLNKNHSHLIIGEKKGICKQFRSPLHS